MNVVPPSDLDDARIPRQALADNPILLRRRPASPSFRTNQHRRSRHTCPLMCKQMGKHSHKPTDLGKAVLSGGLQRPRRRGGPLEAVSTRRSVNCRHAFEASRQQRAQSSTQRGTCPITALRRSASRCHSSRFSRSCSTRSTYAKRISLISRASSSFTRRCSTSMFNSVICRRIIGTGSDASAVSGGGILRTSE